MMYRIYICISIVFIYIVVNAVHCSLVTTSRMESRALRSSWSLLHGERKGRGVKGEERR